MPRRLEHELHVPVGILRAVAGGEEDGPAQGLGRHVHLRRAQRDGPPAAEWRVLLGVEKRHLEHLARPRSRRAPEQRHEDGALRAGGGGDGQAGDVGAEQRRALGQLDPEELAAAAALEIVDELGDPLAVLLDQGEDVDAQGLRLDHVGARQDVDAGGQAACAGVAVGVDDRAPRDRRPASWRVGRVHLEEALRLLDGHLDARAVPGHEQRPLLPGHALPLRVQDLEGPAPARAALGGDHVVVADAELVAALDLPGEAERPVAAHELAALDVLAPHHRVDRALGQPEPQLVDGRLLDREGQQRLGGDLPRPHAEDGHGFGRDDRLDGRGLEAQGPRGVVEGEGELPLGARPRVEARGGRGAQRQGPAGLHGQRPRVPPRPFEHDGLERRLPQRLGRPLEEPSPDVDAARHAPRQSEPEHAAGLVELPVLEHRRRLRLLSAALPRRDVQQAVGRERHHPLGQPHPPGEDLAADDAARPRHLAAPALVVQARRLAGLGVELGLDGLRLHGHEAPGPVVVAVGELRAELADPLGQEADVDLVGLDGLAVAQLDVRAGCHAHQPRLPRDLERGEPRQGHAVAAPEGPLHDEPELRLVLHRLAQPHREHAVGHLVVEQARAGHLEHVGVLAHPHAEAAEADIVDGIVDPRPLGHDAALDLGQDRDVGRDPCLELLDGQTDRRGQPRVGQDEGLAARCGVGRVAVAHPLEAPAVHRLEQQPGPGAEVRPPALVLRPLDLDRLPGERPVRAGQHLRADRQLDAAGLGRAEDDGHLPPPKLPPLDGLALDRAELGARGQDDGQAAQLALEHVGGQLRVRNEAAARHRDAGVGIDAEGQLGGLRRRRGTPEKEHLLTRRGVEPPAALGPLDGRLGAALDLVALLGQVHRHRRGWEDGEHADAEGRVLRHPLGPGGGERAVAGDSGGEAAQARQPVAAAEERGAEAERQLGPPRRPRPDAQPAGAGPHHDPHALGPRRAPHERERVGQQAHRCVAALRPRDGHRGLDHERRLLEPRLADGGRDERRVGVGGERGDGGQGRHGDQHAA